jgi:hypothetical protein
MFRSVLELLINGTFYKYTPKNISCYESLKNKKGGFSLLLNGFLRRGEKWQQNKFGGEN